MPINVLHVISVFTVTFVLLDKMLILAVSPVCIFSLQYSISSDSFMHNTAYMLHLVHLLLSHLFDGQGREVMAA